jgi:hypothetical protein
VPSEEGEKVDIRINDQRLDFTIESNDTLGDVVKDLEDWLKGSDLVLYSIKHDDQEILNRPYDEWAAIPHGDVGTLAVTVKHARDLAVLNLKTILEFLSLLTDALEAPETQALQGLMSGFPSLVESVYKHFATPNLALSALTAMFQDVRPEEAASWPEEKRERARRLIDVLAAAVSFRLQEMEDPKAALRTLSGTIESCMEEIGEISILLQTGKDRQAMDAIIRFSELSQSLVRLVAVVLSEAGGEQPKVGGMDLQEFYRKLNGILSELLDAFDVKDSVLIGDLMEYEMVPRLGELRAFLQELP